MQKYPYKKIIIENYSIGIMKFFLVNENYLIERFDYKTNKFISIKGNIYLGKVCRIETSIQAIFVDIGRKKSGFLPFSMVHMSYSSNNHRNTIQCNVRNGQIILVQVEKDERGNKGASLTTYISIMGKFFIFFPNSNKIGYTFSKKIKDVKTKTRIKQALLRIILNYRYSYIIIRTSCLDTGIINIKNDFYFLINIWQKIKNKALYLHSPSLVYKDNDAFIYNIKECYNNNVRKIIIHGNYMYKKILKFMCLFIPHSIKKIERYNCNIPVSYKYKLNRQLHHINSNKVKLLSGGYIIINITEALVVIDVNSGKYKGSNNMESTAYQINMDAAQEIANQVILRNLSGLIVVDFIDMGNFYNVRKIERIIRKSFWGDKAKIQFGRISLFGLFEMSRQRAGPNLFELSYSCTNDILIKNNSFGPILSIMEKIYLIVLKNKLKSISVFACNAFILELINYFKIKILKIEQAHKIKINLYINNILVYNEYRIFTNYIE